MIEKIRIWLRLWILRRGDARLSNRNMRMYFKATKIEDMQLAGIYFEDLVDQQLRKHQDQSRLCAESVTKRNILWLVHYMLDPKEIRRNFEYYGLMGVYEERKAETPEFDNLRAVIDGSSEN